MPDAPRTARRGRRTRVAEGVYKDRYGLAATVKVHGVQREIRFPRGTPLKTIRARRDQLRASLRTLPHGARHTLAHDAGRYLDQVESTLVSFKDRERHIAMWLPKFGHLHTLALPDQIPALNVQLRVWRETRSAATCNLRRDALTNLVKMAISEFPKWRKYLISLSFRGQSSVRPVQVGGFDVNIDIHRSTAVRGRGGPARHHAWPPYLGAILAHTDGPCGS